MLTKDDLEVTLSFLIKLNHEKYLNYLLPYKIMNILFDFISLQDYHNGGEEYVRRVLLELIKNKTLNIYALYDSKKKFLDDDYNFFKDKIYFVDIKEYNISQIVTKYNIETFYIGIAQRYVNYNLNNINCRTVCTIHDIGDIEIFQNNIQYHFRPTFKNYIRNIIDILFPFSFFSSKKRIYNAYNKLIRFITKENVEIVTVSNYTKNSLLYYFPKLHKEKIEVYYAPQKDYTITKEIRNDKVKNLIESKNRYLFFVNANRENKNFYQFEKCIPQLLINNPNLYIVITNANNINLYNERVIRLNYISNTEMEALYKNALALVYPSFTEGFGYPPLEAIKYSTPVICTNTCSIPEIIETVGIYFSPFYDNDLYSKISYCLNNNDIDRSKLRIQYELVSKKQKEDLKKLIQKIIK